jgi:hypothetical protein
MTLTKAHLHVLLTESNLWGVGKGDFLTMLLRRKHGELVFERPKHAPLYTFANRQLLESERYAWYLPKIDVPKLEGDCRRLGKITVSTWAALAINHWIGQPGGIAEAELVRLFDAHINLALPTADAPAEPYWGIYGADKDGRTCRGLWAAQPGVAVVFSSRADALKAVRFLPPPPDEPLGSVEKGSVTWAVRGLSKENLGVLRDDPAVKLLLGSVRDNGDLIVQPLPPPRD